MPDKEGHRETAGEKGKSAGQVPAVPPEPLTTGSEAAPDVLVLYTCSAPGLLPLRGPQSPRGLVKTGSWAAPRARFTCSGQGVLPAGYLTCGQCD